MLEQTPKELERDLKAWLEPWFASLFDDHITVGDWVIYLTFGLVCCGIVMSIMAHLEYEHGSVLDGLICWFKACILWVILMALLIASLGGLIYLTFTAAEYFWNEGVGVATAFVAFASYMVLLLFSAFRWGDKAREFFSKYLE